jgi:excisionase family DNA binding protein
MNLLRVKDVAERLNVATKTVYRKITYGQLKVIRVGRAIRISEDAVNDYLNSIQETGVSYG